MQIIGYIIYGLSALTTLGWCLRIREKTKVEQAREKSFELQGFLMTVSLVVIPVLNLSSFNLLWMMPASLVLGLLTAAIPYPFGEVFFVFSSLYFKLWYIGIASIGRQHYLAGDYYQAIDAYEDEIAKNPNSADTHFNLGLAYGKIGQHEKEIEAYEQAVKLNPKRPELYFNLGTAYRDSGNHQSAINAMNEAIRLRPEYLKAHYSLCKTFLELDDRINAEKEFEIVKKLDRNAADELAELINKS